MFLRATLYCIASFFLVSPLSAKTIDLRKATDADGSIREISFCARPSPDKPGLPGHAFIAYSWQPALGDRVFRAIGHTVSSVGDAILSYSSVFLPAAGALASEKYTSVKQECLTIIVNKPEFDASYIAMAQPLKELGVIIDESKPIQRAYTLGAEDCVGLVLSEANRFANKGLKIPVRQATDLPLPYIRKFINAN